MRTIPWVLAGGLLLSVAAGADTDPAQPRWSDHDACPVTQTEVQEWLQQQRVVLIGERHDAYAHHQVQLDLIRALDRAQPDTWALGLEFVQQPFQDELDAYVAGTLDERELLNRIDYFRRWGYDYRLYRPILRYARERGLPLLALNADGALIDAVGSLGLDGLAPAQRARLPALIEPIEGPYREQLRAVFGQHAGDGGAEGFERFLDVQRTWDSVMAARAAEYLATHPERRLIVLAGGGHLALPGSLPDRLRQRLPVSAAVLLPADEIPGPTVADYRYAVAEQPLQAVGRLGIRLGPGDGVSAATVLPGSAAERAGIRDRDRIVGLGGQPIASVADLRHALLDRAPGERIRITVRRADTEREQALDLTLD